MTQGRHDHAVRFVAGEQLGQLVAVRELAPHPHYGKRAEYRCACGALVERVSGLVRISAGRALAKEARDGRTRPGPRCGAWCKVTGGRS